MAVTAKFKVNRNTDMTWAREVEMTPDYANGRNKEWAEATPSGMIRMTIKNEVASAQFKEGDPITVIFVTNPAGETTDEDVQNILNAYNSAFSEAWALERDGKREEAIAALERQIEQLRKK